MRSCKVSISGQVYHICRRNGIGESGRPRPLCLTVRSAKQRRRVPASGLALSALRYAVLNKGAAFPLPGSPSPSSLRDATSPKVRGLGSPPSFPVYTLRPAAARGAVRRYAETFRLCQGLPLWGSWREAPERASPLPGRQGLCLADAFGRERADPPDPAQSLLSKPHKAHLCLLCKVLLNCDQNV